MSKINVNTVEPEGASTNLVLGASGDTISIPSGAVITNNGTANGFGVSNTYVEVHLSSDQSLTKNVKTKVQFDTEDFDPNGWFDNSTNYRFTPDESGVYFFSCTLTHGNGTGADSIDLFYYKNGSEVFSNECAADTGGYTHQIVGTAIIQLNGSTDYVEVYTENGSNGTLTLDAQGFNCSTATNNRLCIMRLT